MCGQSERFAAGLHALGEVLCPIAATHVIVVTMKTRILVAGALLGSYAQVPRAAATKAQHYVPHAYTRAELVVGALRPGANLQLERAVATAAPEVRVVDVEGAAETARRAARTRVSRREQVAAGRAVVPGIVEVVSGSTPRQTVVGQHAADTVEARVQVAVTGCG